MDGITEINKLSDASEQNACVPSLLVDEKLTDFSIYLCVELFISPIQTLVLSSTCKFLRRVLTDPILWGAICEKTLSINSPDAETKQEIENLSRDLGIPTLYQFYFAFRRRKSSYSPFLGCYRLIPTPGLPMGGLVRIYKGEEGGIQIRLYNNGNDERKIALEERLSNMYLTYKKSIWPRESWSFDDIFSFFPRLRAAVSTTITPNTTNNEKNKNHEFGRLFVEGKSSFLLNFVSRKSLDNVDDSPFQDHEPLDSEEGGSDIELEDVLEEKIMLLRPLPCPSRTIIKNKNFQSSNSLLRLAASLEGFYESLYSSHGNELIYVYVYAQESNDNLNIEIRGLKVIGDPNVPAARHSFVVNLTDSPLRITQVTRDPRPCVSFQFPTGMSLVSLVDREYQIECAFAGKGQINREPGIWEPEFLDISFVVYKPHSNINGQTNFRFAVIWGDGEHFRHILDFSSFSLP